MFISLLLAFLKMIEIPLRVLYGNSASLQIPCICAHLCHSLGNKQVELMPGGANVEVNEDNKLEYVLCVCARSLRVVVLALLFLNCLFGFLISLAHAQHSVLLLQVLGTAVRALLVWWGAATAVGLFARLP